jgi:hypothetical protein
MNMHEEVGTGEIKEHNCWKKFEESATGCPVLSVCVDL